MPVCYKIVNDNFSLGLWELLEDENKLLDQFSKIAPKNEILRANEFRYPARKLEWIATRLLTYNLLNKVIPIDYDKNGKPIIGDQNFSISISHTKGMVAVIIAKNMTGIDIEMINDRVLRIEDKFMSGIERSQANQENKIQNLLLYWSAKETLYKVHGGKGLDFKKNIHIKPFDLASNGELTGEIISSNQVYSFRLNYFNYSPPIQNNNYLIVYYYN